MKAYDITLYWHEGGSLYLGVGRGANPDDAAHARLEEYMAYSKKQAEEIENGGGFQLDAALIGK